jgi:uncharacterized protein with HEPN domain
LERISEGKILKDLIHDDYYFHAVRNTIEVIGEASKTFQRPKEGYPDISWHEMAGIRDRIIHGYFSIDYSIVWNVISADNQDLKPKLNLLLKN